MGEPEERLKHREALIAYFESHTSILDEDAKRRLHSNPLRILDTKNPAMQELVEGAPKLMDFLGADSRAHLQGVCAVLDMNGVEYSINPRLVRGMDYYNLTVFEFITDQLGSQGTICGGGRYDYLMAQMGGKSAPAVGWAMGVERVIELLKDAQLIPSAKGPDVFAVVPESNSIEQVMFVLQTLRAKGVSVQMHSPSASGNPGSAAASADALDKFARGSMKSQFKRADASGASFALIFGGEELSKGVVTIKSLRDGVGAQREESIAQIDRWASSLQSGDEQLVETRLK